MIELIVRPERASYEVAELGSERVSVPSGVDPEIMDPLLFERKDFTLLNERGMTLQCSMWVREEREAAVPCVVYLHGNSGCRRDALGVAHVVLPLGLSLCAFDFSGSGQSDGQYVSLGWWEREDLKVVIDYLRRDSSVSSIALWGRSMGASTALMHSDRDPSIAALVLDSPFSSLTKLAHELVAKNAPRLPSLATSAVLAMVDSTCQQKANFSLGDLEPIAHAAQCFIPALFGAGKQDKFVTCHHASDLHAKYAGEKELIIFEGDHHTQRTDEFYDQAKRFLQLHLTYAETYIEMLEIAPVRPSRRREVPPDQGNYRVSSAFQPSGDSRTSLLDKQEAVHGGFLDFCSGHCRQPTGTQASALRPEALCGDRAHTEPSQDPHNTLHQANCTASDSMPWYYQEGTEWKEFPPEVSRLLEARYSLYVSSQGSSQYSIVELSHAQCTIADFDSMERRSGSVDLISALWRGSSVPPPWQPQEEILRTPHPSL